MQTICGYGLMKKNEYGEELLKEFRKTESEIQAEGFLKDCKW